MLYFETRRQIQNARQGQIHDNGEGQEINKQTEVDSTRIHNQESRKESSKNNNNKIKTITNKQKIVNTGDFFVRNKLNQTLLGLLLCGI